MVVRFYSSVAQVSALVGSITNVATTMTLTTVSGWPTSTPFTAVIDPDTPTAEIVNVSATAGTTYTIQRGIDGTSATSHNASAVVRHMASARDFADSRSHENATADVHGIGPSASLVGTTTTQTLTNKTLTSPVINGGTFDNIGPLGSWTTFTPVLQTSGGSVTGTPPATNNGRYIKVGRQVTLFMELIGNGGMVFPGGDSQTVYWNVPAQLAPRNPSGSGVYIGGTAVFNALLALSPALSAYTNGTPGFTIWYPSSGGGYTTIQGSNIKAGYPLSHSITYESAT